MTAKSYKRRLIYRRNNQTTKQKSRDRRINYSTCWCSYLKTMDWRKRLSNNKNKRAEEVYFFTFTYLRVSHRLVVHVRG